MTDLQRLCDALNGTAIVLEERSLPLLGEAVRTAASSLMVLHEVARNEVQDIPLQVVRAQVEILAAGALA